MIADRTCRFALFACFIFAMTSSVFAGRLSANPLPVHPAAATKPVPILSSRVGAKGALTTKYTIVDFGSPPTATYSSSSIVAFNDSNQIVGTAKHGAVTDCVLFTGATFISLSPSPSVSSCTPTAMNNLNSRTKTSSIVGYINYAFADGTVAFAAAASAQKLVSMTLFSSNVSSQLNAINDTGQAIGTTYYAPPGGFTGPPIVSTKGGTNLTLAQPTCTHRLTICSRSLVFEACSFGGCDFDDKGDVEAVPLFTGATSNEILNITTGKCCTTSDEYLSTSLHYISDYGDAVGSMVDFSEFDLLVDDEDLGQPVQSEELQGCSNNPISFSNKGNVLVVSECYPGHENWTWDPAHGFVDIANTLPANSYAEIVPLGINDEGDILVELDPHRGPIHWGVLLPPATQHAAHASGIRRQNSRMRL